MTGPVDDEQARVREAYTRRERRGLDARYEYWRPANLYIYQERERALLAALAPRLPLYGLHILDAGCGDGSVLRDCLRYGARPDDLYGIDLLPERVQRARERTPGAHVEVADARALPYPDAHFDLVLAFTLLSSVLDRRTRQSIADEFMRVTRPGGSVIVYDFWTNPFNRDARPVGRRELRALFRDKQASFRATTPAPPLVRLLAGLPGGWLACTALGMIPFVKTHYLATVQI